VSCIKLRSSRGPKCEEASWSATTVIRQATAIIEPALLRSRTIWSASVAPAQLFNRPNFACSVKCQRHERQSLASAISVNKTSSWSGASPRVWQLNVSSFTKCDRPPSASEPFLCARIWANLLSEPLMLRGCGTFLFPAGHPHAASSDHHLFPRFGRGTESVWSDRASQYRVRHIAFA